MGMFDDIVVNAKSVANAVSEKACNVYDISKLKVSASSLRGEINNKLVELGEMTYSSKYGKAIEQKEIDAKIEEIKTLKDDLRTIHVLLAKAKNYVMCQSCSAVVTKGSVYCSKCGEKIVVNKTDDCEE